MEDQVERLINELRAARHRKEKNHSAVPEARAPGKPLPTLAELMGVDPRTFLPADKLSPEQAARLTQAILGLWKDWGIEAVYPEDFPPHLFYPLLVAKFFDFRVPDNGYAPGKTIYVGFCDYNPARCPFGRKYCPTCWDDGAEQEMLQA